MPKCCAIISAAGPTRQVAYTVFFVWHTRPKIRIFAVPIFGAGETKSPAALHSANVADLSGVQSGGLGGVHPIYRVVSALSTLDALLGVGTLLRAARGTVDMLAEAHPLLQRLLGRDSCQPAEGTRSEGSQRHTR